MGRSGSLSWRKPDINYRLVDEHLKFLEDRGIYIDEYGELPLPGLSQGIDTTTETTAETIADEVDGQGEISDEVLQVQPFKLTLLSALASDESLSEKLLFALTQLLESDRYTLLLTGLMAVTGRSPGELLKSGVFEAVADEPFALSFSATGVGAKSRLVTLVNADAVTDGVQRLRLHERVQDLRYLPPNEIDSSCLVHVAKVVYKNLPFADIQEMLATYSRFTGDNTALLPQKPSHPPTVSGSFYESDKQRLVAIASRLSFEGTQPQIFHALLDWVEATLDEPEPQQEEKSASESYLEANSSTSEPAASPNEATFATALTHQAQTLAWLTRRVESLEKQVSQLQTERDEALALAEQFRPLKQENQQLRQENQSLQQTASRFEAARQALLGEQMTLPITSPEPLKTTQRATATPVAPSKGRRQRSEGKAVARAKKIVEAISQWNQSHRDDTWAITRGLLEEGFKIHRQAADAFLEQERDWIAQIHSEAGITGVRGHNRRKDVAQLKAWVEQQT